MIGTITPLVHAAADGQIRWAKAVTAYATGTAIATIAVGACLGVLGQALGGPYSWASLVLATATAGLAIHEAGFVQLPAPMIERQTQQIWRRRFGSTRASLLWGGDIGLLFTTRTTFLSLWFVAAAALASASPHVGALIVGGYGIGRILLVLTGPLLDRPLVDGSSHFPGLPTQRTWHRLHAVLLVAAVVLLLAAYVRK